MGAAVKISREPLEELPTLGDHSVEEYALIPSLYSGLR